MRRAPRHGSVIVALSLLGGVAMANAEAVKGPATARLSWVRTSGAESCVDAAALEADVDLRLGRDAFGGTPSRSIEGVISRTSKGWIAHLYIRNEAGALLGEREIGSDAEACTSLSSAVGLAIALAIDPEAALAPPPSSASSAPLVASASVSPPRSTTTIAASVPPPNAPIAREPEGTHVALRAGVTSGLVPRVASVFALDFEPARDWLVRPRLGALFVPSTRTTDGAFGFGVTAARLAGCHDLAGDDAAAVTICVGALVGVVHAVVYGLEPITPGDRAWAGASTAADARVRLFGPLSLVASFDAIWPFVRHRFLIEGKGSEVFQQPFVALMGTLGLVARL